MSASTRSALLAVVVATLSAAPAEAGALSAGTPGNARVAQAPMEPDPAPEDDLKMPAWYGWQIVLVDVVAFVLLDDGNQSRSGGELILGGALFLGSGPTIHGIHGRWGLSLLSGGMRLVAPFVGLAAYEVVFGDCHRHDEWRCSTSENAAANYSFIGTMAIVSLVDAILGVRASASPERATSSPPASRRASLEWTPTLRPARDGGATFGVVGRF